MDAFLDDDPEAISHILYFLRYNKLDFSTKAEAMRTRPVAKKVCPPMVKLIDDLLTQKSKRKRIKLTVVRRQNIENNPNHFICTVPDGRIIGCENLGCESKSAPQSFVDEYSRRQVFPELCYSWSGNGDAVYNVHNGKLIGEGVGDWAKHEVLSDDDKFLKLGIINNAVKKTHDRFYLCAFNSLGTFSIFDATSGDKLLPNQSFTTIADCVKELRTQIRNKAL